MGCDNSKSASPKVLHVFNWADYIAPEVLQEFEKTYNCQVVVDNFESNEAMYAKIQAGAKGYDVIFPSSYMAKLMNDKKLLLPLDHKLLPNLKYLDPQLLPIITQDPTMNHSVPYLLSMAGLGYDPKKIPNFEASWAMFDRQDLKGKITLLSDIRETLGAALKFLGYSINTINEKELEQARDVVIRWKKNIAKFAVEDAKMGLGSGEFVMVHQYNGDIYQVVKENPDIQFALPKEGFSLASDDMVIPDGAQEIELAHQFINFFTDPKICAKNMEFLRYASINIEARKYLSQEFLQSPAGNVTPEIIRRGEVIKELGDDVAKYNKVWSQVKAAE